MMRAILISKINAYVYIAMYNLLIPLIENWFGDEIVFWLFVCFLSKGIKAMQQERHMKSITYPAIVWIEI